MQVSAGGLATCGWTRVQSVDRPVYRLSLRGAATSRGQARGTSSGRASAVDGFAPPDRPRAADSRQRDRGLRLAAGLAPLAALRGTRLVIDGDAPALAVVDERAAERLIGRLLATLISAGAAGRRSSPWSKRVFHRSRLQSTTRGRWPKSTPGRRSRLTKQGSRPRVRHSSARVSRSGSRETSRPDWGARSISGRNA